MNSRPLVDRFHEKYTKGGEDACWPWLAACHKDGHGKIHDGGVRGAHIVALELHSGEAAAGRHALHSCDNPPCVNPKHLRWGSNTDNVQDCVSRDRRDKSRRALTDDDVRYVLEALAAGASENSIAKHLGKTGSCTIGRIAKGKVYRDVVARLLVETH
jgi:hypothetical protein